MKVFSLQLRFSCLALILVLAGCLKPPSVSHDSGFGILSKQIKVPTIKVPTIKVPPIKPASVMKKMHEKLTHKVFVAGTTEQVRAGTRKVLIAAIKDVDGVPRIQTQKLIEDLVRSTEGACAGASCAKVFGIKPDDVDFFLDDCYVKVEKDEVLAMPENSSLRESLLGSLYPEPELTLPKLSEEQTAKNIERIYDQPSVEFEVEAQLQPPPHLGKEKIEKLLDDKELKAITQYTSFFYQAVRHVETYPGKALESFSKDELREAAELSEKIFVAQKKMPKNDSIIYRGISKVEPNDLAHLLECKDKKIAIGLGPELNPSVTSATWDPSVAERFMGVYRSNDPRHGYHIVYVIHTKRGTNIEAISKVPWEHEVLIPRDAKFEILNINPVKDKKTTILVELKDAA